MLKTLFEFDLKRGVCFSHVFEENFDKIEGKRMDQRTTFAMDIYLSKNLAVNKTPVPSWTRQMQTNSGISIWLCDYCARKCHHSAEHSLKCRKSGKEIKQEQACLFLRQIYNEHGSHDVRLS